jgi:hypothetical protein
MADRFGLLKLTCYEADDLGTPLTKTGDGLNYLYLLEAHTRASLNAQGDTTAVFPVQTDMADIVAVGRIATIYYTDTVLAAEFSVGVPFCGAFIIQNVEPFSDERGDLVRISGQDLMEELKNTACWDIIAEVTTIATTTDASVADVANTTVDVGAPANNDNAILDSVSGVEVGDEVRITMNGAAGVHVTVVTSIDPPGAPANTIQFEDRIPYNADAGNAVQFRKRLIPVASTDGISPGMEARIELDDASNHDTFVEEVSIPDGTITIQAGVPDSVTSGNDVTIYDYSQPALTDIDDIIALDSDWDVQYDGAFTGTEDGTRHAPDGLNLYELLQAAARQSGEFFRLDESVAPATAVRRIEWKRTFDYAGAGGDFRLVVPTSASAAVTDAADPDRGIIYGTVTRRNRWNPASRVYPFSGDERVTLLQTTTVGQSYITLHGYTLITSGLGKYEPPYIRDNTLETDPAIGIRARVENFTHVRAESDQVEVIATAADALAYEAVNFLNRHQSIHEFYTVTDVVCRPLYPGQRVELVYSEPNGLWSISKTTTNALYVLDVSRNFGSDGICFTTLHLSNVPYDEPTTAGAIANNVSIVDQLARRAARNGVTVTLGSAGGGGTGGGVTDHGALTGLADDDHAQYVKTSGDGLGLTYNAGIRGFDVALETDSGLTLAGGELTLGTPTAVSATSTNSVSGSGHTHDVTSTNDGHTNPSTLLQSGTGGGVYLTRIGLNTLTGSNAIDIDGSIKFQGTNHIQFDQVGAATIQNTGQDIGLYALTLTLDPSGGIVTVDGGMSLTGGARTIKTTAGALTVGTDSGGLTLDPASGLVTVDADMVFSGGGKTISTASDTLTLAPAGELLLDSVADVVRVQANNALYRQGFSSGFLGTGWGIQYDGTADFRFLRADELHVMSFIADIARVSVGAHYTTPSMAELSRPFTIPAVSSTGTLYVNDVPGFPDTQVFNDEDWLMIRTIDRSSGGLATFLVWGQVSGYTDLAADEQSWTFTTRSANAAAVGEIAGAGLIALDFGKSGNGWAWTTAIGTDTPYFGITTWHGSDPYTEGNRKHRLRLGQLIGVTGNYEWGLHAGLVTSNRAIFSDLRNEIHGTRLSLYANDNAEFEVQEVELRFTYDTSSTADILPNGDGTTFQAESTGAAYYTQINQGYNTPDAPTFINNEPGKSAEVWLEMQDAPAFTTLNNVQYRIRHDGTNFADDTCSLYIQVFKTDGKTPLTSEELVSARTGNAASGTGAVSFSFIDKSQPQGVWNNMKVRLRWEYSATATPETIRLDPSVPSIAVGFTLPTGLTTGGTGFWTGRSGVGGTVGMRIGDPTGVRMQWNGTNLQLFNASNVSTIQFDGSGDGYFAGVMNIGTSGGIFQGTGTFASPTTALKIFNSGGVGRLQTYNSGTLQVELNTSGYLTAGAGKVILNADGVEIRADNFASPYTHTADKVDRVSFVRDDGTTLLGYVAGQYVSSSAAKGVVLAAEDNNDAIFLYHNSDHHWRSTNDIEIEPNLADGTGFINLEGHIIVKKSASFGNFSVIGNEGQILTDLSNGTYNTFVLMDTTAVAHGMTTVVNTAQYAWLGKVSNTGGGLDLAGFTEGQVGMQFAAYSTSVGTGSATTSPGAFTFYGLKKSGTTADLMEDTGNLVSIRNGSASVKTVVLIKGDGDIYNNGGSTTMTTFDDYDDMHLVRAADLGAAGMLDETHAQWLKYNKADLEAARLVEFNDDTDGVPFINTTRMQKLHSGAIWQAAQRIERLEARIQELEEALWQA